MGRYSVWISLLMVAALVLVAWPVEAAIAGSPHDFSDDAWFTGDPDHAASYQQNNQCRICHKPHHAQSAQEGLLWNHGMSTAVYTMYDSTWSESIDGAVDPQPTGHSRLCLSCHDGTVALENWDGVTSPTQTTYAATLGIDIPVDQRLSHPISIVYDDTADTALQPTSSTFDTGTTVAEVLRNGKVQCSTCHDPHREDVASQFSPMMLRGSGTALCLTCHIK